MRHPPCSTLFPYTTLFRSLALCEPLSCTSSSSSIRTSAARWASSDHGKRSEEHTSELQSRRDLVCRPLLEKKKPSLWGLQAATAQHRCTVASAASTPS